MIEKVGEPYLSRWKASKTLGPGRDRRFLAPKYDAVGDRFMTFDEVMTAISVPAKPSKTSASSVTSTIVSMADTTRLPLPDDWPSRGSAFMELFQAIRASGKGLPPYHAFWVASSGVADKCPPAPKHRDLPVLLIHFGTIDQISFPWVAGIDSLFRFVLLIEAAVKKCPKRGEVS